jgi:hypothetical protein
VRGLAACLEQPLAHSSASFLAASRARSTLVFDPSIQAQYAGSVPRPWTRSS